ncbi:MAG: histidine kinase [Anaerolineales bacterium]|nr:histidine kinase [Anaerolineales bacterium]
MSHADEVDQPSGTLVSWLRSNLRAKFAIGLALPLLLILAGLSIIDYVRARRTLETQMALTAERLGAVTLSSLRHGMLVNDPIMVSEVLENVVAMDDISNAQIINTGGEAAFTGPAKDAAADQPPIDVSCTVCHQHPASQRPSSIQLSQQQGLLRVAAPIRNDPGCMACHGTGATHLGVLLLDVSVSEMHGQLQQDLQVNLALSGGGTLLVTLAAYVLSNSLVVGKLDRFRAPLARFSQGDFGARIQTQSGPNDEVDRLAKAFNEMAEHFERSQHAKEARTHVRQHAIHEERDRIARELHDGVAQLLGYVNTKATAARLKLQRGDVAGAEELLRQLETAAKEVFTDVRAAILGLKASNRAGLVFPENLRQYVERFRELSGMPVTVELGRVPLPNRVPAETELQLLRITQEALANSHKHSHATAAQVTVDISPEFVELRISDNGIGFDPDEPKHNGRPHFGLSTMRERADAVNAEFSLESEPGQGTVVWVRAPLSRSNMP